MTSLDTHLHINALVEMGFPKERVEQAVKSVKNPDIQTLVEWLSSHPIADPDSGHKLGGISEDKHEISGNGETANDQGEKSMDKSECNTASTASSTSSSETVPTVALSLVCEDCGKQIKSEMDAQTHAARSGHQNFAESTQAIKPLTPEEKEEQKMRLQKKLEERRKQREEAEKEQQKLREKTRRKTGKEVTQAKEELAYQEMKRVAEERRKDKLEEKRLKQKLKDDIARDRAEFKRQQQQSSESIKNNTPKAASPAAQPIVTKREYDSCRIQFRLMDGSTHNSNFKAEDTLRGVYDHISEKAALDIPFNLSMTFPRKTFSQAELSKSLKELGLVPSAVLVLSKV